ncbi:MAG: permease [Anaerolineales bacterium]|jgi:uncharacterized membrane protein YraQ (UPF0718 family)
MTSATLILTGIALIMAILAYRRGKQVLLSGLEIGWQTFLRTAMLLLLAFSIVGFINVLSPQEFVRSLIGPSSGFRGLLVGEATGMLLPGGPYVVFPLIASLFEAGAGIGPTLALITSWANLSLLSISFELPFLSWRFSGVRLTIGLAIPLLIGIAGHLLFGP